MIDDILQIIAPHYCYGCGGTGPVLCPNCKYDIIDEGFSGCIVCNAPSRDGVCRTCKTTYDKAWCVGERGGALERTIDEFKFKRARSAYKPLGDLLHQTLPSLPESTVLVPVPTIAKHVRQRGYDHTRLLARRLAKIRRLPLAAVLARSSATVQRDARKRRRLEQAKTAFSCRRQLEAKATYLLIDDVVTTNATLRYAAAALRQAGARQVWAAVLARQPLDKANKK
jgi:ComF family protein